MGGLYFSETSPTGSANELNTAAAGTEVGIVMRSVRCRTLSMEW